ncbi:MAG: hypothetical protein K6G27_15230 [Lachnospiraceae bacterium]|nr:hypothetical protein [Lachnospiraceae bacterium]
MEESKMRTFRKLFLAAGLIGLLGTLGFAKEAQAATRTASVTVEDGMLSWSWTSTDPMDEAMVTEAVFKIGNQVVYETTGAYGVDDGETDAVDIIEEINSNIENFNEDKLTQVTATLTLDAGGTISGKGSFALYRVDVKPDSETKGYVEVDGMSNTFYALSGDLYTATAYANDGYQFKNWTGIKPGDTADVEIEVKNAAVKLVANFTKSAVPIQGVTITTSASTVDVGDEVTFTAKVTPETAVLDEDYTLSWTLDSNFEKIAQTGNKFSARAIKAATAAKVSVTATPTAGGDVKTYSGTIKINESATQTVTARQGKSSSSLGTATVTLENGEKLYFDATVSPSTYDRIEWLIDGDVKSTSKSGNITNNNESGSSITYKLKARAYFNGSSVPVESNELTFIFKTKGTYVPTTFKIDSDQLEYITQGYKLEVKGTVTGTFRDGATITFEKNKGDGIKVKDVTFSKKDDSTNNFSFKIDTSDCSVSSGETLKGTIKVTAKGGKEESGVIKDYVNEEFFSFEVFPKSSLSYASDTRKFSYTAPKSVNTGTESGKESDGDKDHQLTNFTGCKGVLIKVWKGDVSGDPLWTSTSATSGGNSATINAESLVTALNNDKKLSDSGDFKFRVYPCNSDNKYNKNVYSETTIHIYKVTVTGTGVTTTNYYALSGQEIEITATPIDSTKTWTADSYWMDDASKKEGQKRKVKVTEDKTYTAVLGTKTTSDNSASGRAGVNKWGQNNVGIYFAVVLVIGAVCLGLHLYDRKKKNI